MADKNEKNVVEEPIAEKSNGSKGGELNKYLIISLISTVILCVVFAIVNYIVVENLLTQKISKISVSQEEVDENGEEEGDEVQKGIAVLEQIKIICDASDKRGQFILSGSQKLQLMKGMSESLAGRVSIIEMLGLSLREIKNVKFNKHFIPTNAYFSERENELNLTKCDLEEKREVSKEEAEKFRKENNIDLFFETSAKSGFNAKNIFAEAAKLIQSNYVSINCSEQKGPSFEGDFDFQICDNCINSGENIANFKNCSANEQEENKESTKEEKFNVVDLEVYKVEY